MKRSHHIQNLISPELQSHTHSFVWEAKPGYKRLKRCLRLLLTETSRVQGGVVPPRGGREELPPDGSKAEVVLQSTGVVHWNHAAKIFKEILKLLLTSLPFLRHSCDSALVLHLDLLNLALVVPLHLTDVVMPLGNEI